MGLSSLFLRGTNIGAPEAPHEYPIESLRLQKRTPVLKLENIDNRNAAEALIGADVYAKLEELRPTEEDSYFVSELVGMEVRLVPAQDGTAGKTIGTVIGVIDNPAHDILEIAPAEAGSTGSLLLPLVDAFVQSVDTIARVVTVAPPEGFL